MSIYTNPPAWIRKKGYDTVLTKNGWVAFYPNGKQELVVALRNVPEKYLINKPTFQEPIKEPIKQPKPAPTVFNVDETKEKASVSVSIAERSIAKSSIAETEKKTYRKPKTTKAI